MLANFEFAKELYQVGISCIKPEKEKNSVKATRTLGCSLLKVTLDTTDEKSLKKIKSWARYYTKRLSPIVSLCKRKLDYY